MSEANNVLAELVTNSDIFSQAVADLVDSKVKTSVRQVTINVDSIKIGAKEGYFHKDFETIAAAMQCGHVMIVGPAGSGKTTLCEQLAELMGLSFYFNGSIQQEYKLIGFKDANGKYHSTPFRQAFENGGLYLFDEIDASHPNTMSAFNAALANGIMDFPDKTVRAHKDFKVIAAANTFGTGRDRLYVGRNQLDAATLDRFINITLDYDTELEATLTDNGAWCEYVQAFRAEVNKQSIRHVVSTRAIIAGAKLLAAGMKPQQVKEISLAKGMASDIFKRIENALDSDIKSAVKAKRASKKAKTTPKAESKPEFTAKPEPEPAPETTTDDQPSKLDGLPSFDDLLEGAA